MVLGIAVCLCVLVLGWVACADSYTYSVALTTTQVLTSAALPVSGWLDKVEIVNTSGATTDVMVATFTGTTPIDQYVYAVANANVAKVIRPRFIGTGNTGTDLAGAVSGASSNAATTVLMASYDRAMLGGNLKVLVTNGVPANAAFSVKIFFDPVKR